MYACVIAPGSPCNARVNDSGKCASAAVAVANWPESAIRPQSIGEGTRRSTDSASTYWPSVVNHRWRPATSSGWE